MLTLAKYGLFVWMLGSSLDPDDPPAIFRSGQIVVQQQADRDGSYHQLLRGRINRGINYVRMYEANQDWSRYPTCYHHRKSPVGQVMERFTWFHEPEHRYWSDARMPASLVGLGAVPLGVSMLPTGQLTGAWSEPPYAVLGMYVGTMAAYARPFQQVDFYENDATTIRLSDPPPGKAPLFTYIQQARKRGADARVFKGAERPTLKARGPRNYYQVLVLEICPRDRLEDISVNLLTREGMGLCFETLAERGILCIHTSNRYINTVPAIADVARSLGYACKRGHTTGSDEPVHFSSEWVMVARKADYLGHLVRSPDNPTLTWEVPRTMGRFAWTDKTSHPFTGLYRSSPQVMAIKDRVQRTMSSALRFSPTIQSRWWRSVDSIFRSWDGAEVRALNREK